MLKLKENNRPAWSWHMNSKTIAGTVLKLARGSIVYPLITAELQALLQTIGSEC